MLVNLFKKDEKPLAEKLKKDADTKANVKDEKFKQYKASKPAKEHKKEKAGLHSLKGRKSMAMPHRHKLPPRV